jgi:hypothetical protein
LTIPNPEHLFEQAERLIGASPAGRPRQVDIRRAISAAYYGVFHATITAAADQVVGVVSRSTNRYALVYRSVDHSRLRALCEQARKGDLPPKLVPHAPAEGFGAEISAFAAAVLDLQQQRHSADYDPLIRVNTSNAVAAITLARAALRHFRSSGASEREAFLMLLLFEPRR